MASLFILLALLFPLMACQPPADTPTPTKPIRYLALGDSYTIGHGVPEADRYPVQFAERLRADGFETEAPRIVAVTGWTTQNLKNAMQSAALDYDYDLVSLLIGVNNQYQGKPLGEYEQDFNDLLDSAVAHAGGDPKRVFVLSIPDYAYTPFGQNRPDPPGISAALDAFNAANKALTEARDILYFDITPISRLGLEQPELVAPDKLHPSGEMYRQWLEVFYETVKVRLN